MQPSNDLDHLAIAHGSDKFGPHWYTPHYYRHLNELRNQPVTLLEIGIGGYGEPTSGGHSLRMWRSFFSSGKIFGLDFYEKVGMDEERIKVFHGSQSDPVALAHVIGQTPDKSFDIIIDDASHRAELTVTTFLCMFPYIKKGGWYIIEDVETDYLADYGGTLNAGTSELKVINFFKGVIEGLNWQERERYRAPGYRPSFMETGIESVTFYKNMIFVKAGDNL